MALRKAPNRRKLNTSIPIPPITQINAPSAGSFFIQPVPAGSPDRNAGAGGRELATALAGVSSSITGLLAARKANEAKLQREAEDLAEGKIAGLTLAQEKDALRAALISPNQGPFYQAALAKRVGRNAAAHLLLELQSEFITRRGDFSDVGGFEAFASGRAASALDEFSDNKHFASGFGGSFNQGILTIQKGVVQQEADTQVEEQRAIVMADVVNTLAALPEEATDEELVKTVQALQASAAQTLHMTGREFAAIALKAAEQFSEDGNVRLFEAIVDSSRQDGTPPISSIPELSSKVASLRATAEGNFMEQTRRELTKTQEVFHTAARFGELTPDQIRSLPAMGGVFTDKEIQNLINTDAIAKELVLRKAVTFKVGAERRAVRDRAVSGAQDLVAGGRPDRVPNVDVPRSDGNGNFEFSREQIVALANQRNLDIIENDETLDDQQKVDKTILYLRNSLVQTSSAWETLLAAGAADIDNIFAALENKSEVSLGALQAGFSLFEQLQANGSDLVRRHFKGANDARLRYKSLDLAVNTMKMTFSQAAAFVARGYNDQDARDLRIARTNTATFQELLTETLDKDIGFFDFFKAGAANRGEIQTKLRRIAMEFVAQGFSQDIAIAAAAKIIQESHRTIGHWMVPESTASLLPNAGELFDAHLDALMDGNRLEEGTERENLTLVPIPGNSGNFLVMDMGRLLPALGRDGQIITVAIAEIAETDEVARRAELQTLVDARNAELAKVKAEDADRQNLDASASLSKTTAAQEEINQFTRNQGLPERLRAHAQETDRRLRAAAATRANPPAADFMLTPHGDPGRGTLTRVFRDALKKTLGKEREPDSGLPGEPPAFPPAPGLASKRIRLSVRNLDTLLPKEGGRDVTEAAIQVVARIIPGGEQFLLRVAAVESGLGTNPAAFDISRPSYGIFQINRKGYYQEVQRRIAEEPSGITARAAATVKAELGIDLAELQFKDLDRALPSLLFARIGLLRFPQAIPPDSDLEGQARYWKKFYSTSEDTQSTFENFMNAAREFDLD